MCLTILTSNNNLPAASPAITISMKTNWCCNDKAEMFIDNKYNNCPILQINTQLEEPLMTLTKMRT